MNYCLMKFCLFVKADFGGFRFGEKTNFSNKVHRISAIELCTNVS